MNLELSYPGTAPVAAVEKALQYLVSMNKALEVPIEGFARAKGWLKKKGVTFLVTLRVKCGGEEKTDLVPLRVIDGNVIMERLGNRAEEMRSWHGKQICDICVKFCHDLDQIVWKIVGFLKTTANRLIHRRQKKLHHSRRHLQRYARIHGPRMTAH